MHITHVLCFHFTPFSRIFLSHCRVPDRYVIDGVKLGKWVHSQLHYYRNFNVEDRGPNQETAKKRVEMLNAIGFDWRRRKPPRAKPRFMKRRSPDCAEEIKEPPQRPPLPPLPPTAAQAPPIEKFQPPPPAPYGYYYYVYY